MADTRLISNIVGHGEKSPEQLLANPANARIQPQGQQRLLEKALEAVGWIDEVTVNRRTGRVVDGHLRVAIAMRRGEATVPVRYVDLTEEQELVALRTFDPLGDLAVWDDDLLRDLTVQVLETDLVSDLLAELDDIGAPTKSETHDEPKPEPERCPLCGK